jgi:serine/threonine protein phosphatase PrpC
MDLEYYVSQFSSNDPGEDRFSARYIPDYGSFFCVVDGHGGCFSCDVANTIILDYFLEELTKLSSPLKTEFVIEAINESFRRCDELILQQSLTQKHLNPQSLLLSSISFLVNFKL